MKYTNIEILSRIEKIGYKDRIPKNYWICGIRSILDNPDSFDDKFYLFKGKIMIMETTGTTNPGVPNLLKLVNPKGAAVVKSDMWYKNLWTFGYHRGKVKALKQVGPISVYRDADKDTKSEEQGLLDVGYFGINFHSATYKLAGLVRTKIGAWSAGCQVCNDDNAYSKIIDIVKNQSRIDFCLLNEF